VTITLHTKLLSTDDEQHTFANRTPASVRGLSRDWQSWRDDDVVAARYGKFAFEGKGGS
jgi:hypothetical protein